jgi:predicted extracellular nuclease
MDRYLGMLAAPAPGEYDVAFRFSLDGGRAWTLCDQDEGSYEPAASGRLTTVESTGPNLYFSEYVEGTSNYKGLEIYNAGSNPTPLDQCQVLIYFNGNTTPLTVLTLTAHSLLTDEVRVLCHMGLSSSASCDQSDNSIAFNGNDAVELVCGGVTQDVIGQIGFNPGSKWGSGSVTTLDHTLRRVCSVSFGDRIGGDVFDPVLEWEAFPVDTFSGLGARGCN